MLASLSSPAAGLFSSSRLRGTQEGRLYIRRKFGARPGSVARALGCQSRTSWQSNHGFACLPARANQAHRNPKNDIFCSLFHLSLLLFLKYQSRRQRLGSHRTTTAVHYFSICGSHERCFCVSVRDRVCACVIVGSYSGRDQEQSVEKRVQFGISLILILAVLPAAAVFYLHHTVIF